MLALHDYYREWISGFLDKEKINVVFNLSVIVFACLMSFVAYKITAFILSVSVKKIAKTNSVFVTSIIRNKVHKIISWYAPLWVMKYYFYVIFINSPKFATVLNSLYKIFFVLIFTRLMFALLNVLIDLYQSKQSKRSIKGVIQFLQVILSFICFLMIMSILLGIHISSMLTGLGAASAIIMLIFKDSISGFIAGIQISLNDTIHLGDWITIPKYDVDGDVIDITLTSIKVQNFDKSVSTIPTYNLLVNDSVKNWYGMYRYNARQIARSVNIDMTSIKICSPEMVEQFKNVKIITGYLEKTEAEISEWNKANGDSKEDVMPLNNLMQTNFGIFRAYIYEYLRANPKISDSSPLLVRQLQSTATGIPLQIYCFATTTDSTEYEKIQADIFDHILAIIPMFELKVFQSPSGKDLSRYLAAVK